MRKKVFIPAVIVLTLMLLPLSAGAAPVPWNNTWYSALAAKSCCGDWTDATEVLDEGPTLPRYAYAEHYTGPGDYALTEITATTIRMAHDRSEAAWYEHQADITGDFTAADPFFVFYTDWEDGWLTVEDVTTSTTLFDGSPSGSQVYYIATQIGDNISVSFGGGYWYFEAPTAPPYDETWNYSMSLGVAPEPVSSTLFIVGGATLGFRRFRKKRKI